ncbi:MAG: DUF1064 domain-containing protein [Beijerinckiaceae bacterium]|nr:DUF1064 domain-containing protein [Beijerinckiaceae bacterium]
MGTAARFIPNFGVKRGRFAVADKYARTIDGIVFDSEKEAVRYGELRLLERDGQISGLDLQPTFVVEINGKRLCRFKADFAYRCPQRGRVIEDVKSSGTAKDPAYRLRKKAAELAHGIKVTEIIR